MPPRVLFHTLYGGTTYLAKPDSGDSRVDRLMKTGGINSSWTIAIADGLTR